MQRALVMSRLIISRPLSLTATQRALVIDDEEVIYTDGSCLSQHNKKKRRAGYSVYFGDGDARNASEPIEGNCQTNQIGELTAVAVALERASTTKRVTLYTDSHYVIRGLYGLDGKPPWYLNWQRNSWRNTRGRPVEHRELWERAIAAMATRRVAVRYAEAHSGIKGNEIADELARLAAGRNMAATSAPTLRESSIEETAEKTLKEVEDESRQRKRVAKCDCKATICNDGCARMPDTEK